MMETFFILGFSYLCLLPPWRLKLPISLKSGGALPRAQSYITHYFQLSVAAFPAARVSLKTVGFWIQLQVNPHPGVRPCA